LKFTNEQLDILAPNTTVPITEDEYLNSPKLSNDGVDYGTVMNYDPKKEKEMNAFLKTLMRE